MADPKNKWSQPAAPPAPMFFGKKERDLVKQVNDELAERVIGQPIAYYPISIEESNFNDIYGEAIEKVSLPPVRVFAYVEVDNEQVNDRYGYEYRSSLTVNFNRKRLTEDQNLFVRVGDFVQYGEEFYEIVRTYNDTRYYFGQVEHKFQISAECITARAGDFKVMPAISRSVDTTVLEDGSAAPAPRPAPYPPLAASYVTVNTESKLPNERTLAAGAGITITDGGPGNSVTVASTAQAAAGSATQVQLNAGGSGVFGASSNFSFVTGSNILQVTGSVSATRMTASAMNITPISGALAGAGSYLGLDASNNIIVTSSSGTGGGGGGSGIFTEINASQAYVTSSLTIGATSAPTATLHVIGDLTASVALSSSVLQASNYVSGSTVRASQQLMIGSAQITESELETIDGITAGTAAANKAVVLDAAKNIATLGHLSASVLSGTIGALTYLTASFATISGSTTLGASDTDTVTINAQTIALTNVAAGTDNTVLVYNDSSIVTDEIDSRVWGSSLVDGTSTANYVTFWSDTDTVSGDANLTYNGSLLHVGANFRVYGDTTLGDAAGDSVTINAETIDIPNVGAGTGNDVVVYNGSSLVTDEIDSRVWGSTLVDASGTPADNQVGVWTDANTMEGTTGFTYDGAVALVTGSLTASVALSASTAALSYLTASATLVRGTTRVSGGLVHKRVQVATSYTASATDYFMGVTTAPASILFDATAFEDGQAVVVKDESGTVSAVNTITLVSSGSQTIDGSTTDVTIESPYGSVLLYSNGVNWFIY